MAAPTFGNFVRAEGVATSVTVGPPTGLAAGDFQIVVFHGATGSETINNPPAGWTLAVSVSLNGTNSSELRVYTSTTATGNATFGKSGSRAYHIWRGYWKTHNGMVAGSASGAYTGTSGTGAIPAKTPALPESLVIAGAVDDLLDFGQGGAATPPASFTELYDVQTSGSNDDLRMTVASRATTAANQAVSGNFVFSASSNNYVATWSLILTPGYTTIGPVTDSGAGTDAITVAQTRIAAFTDTGAGSDPVLVDRVAEPLADSGVGTDTAFIDILDPVNIADSAVGTDEVTVALFKGNDLVEQGTGSDPVTVDRLFYITPSDQGTGSDSITLRQDKNPTDLGVGTDVLSGLRMPSLVDSGVGTDEILVVDIPYTQVVRRDASLAATVYDLVVVARVPQSGGPPSFLEIDPIEWKTLTYTNTLSDTQELTATAQVSSITEGVLQRLRKPHELATELRLYRNGKVVFAGPLLGWQTSGETLTVKAGGLMTYLKMMAVTTDLVFTGTDQATIVKSLVDAWQALPYGNFGIDTSSITASGTPRTVTYKKTELHNVFTRATEMGKLDRGFDIEIDPASRKLTLWSPRKGVDRSTGEDAIVFDDRNVTSSDIVCSVAIGDLATQAYGTGTAQGVDVPFWSNRENAELLAQYGRVAVTQSFSNVATQADVTGLTQALLDARKAALMVPGPKVRVTPDANLGDYDVGDTVAYDLGGTVSVSGAFRLRKQSISATPTGQETTDLEFV